MELETKLAAAEQRHFRALERLEHANQRRTEARNLSGGLLSFGGSGSQRANRTVTNATDRALRAYSDAWDAVQTAERDIASLQRRIAERDRVRLTREDLAGAVVVRTKLGWHKVIRVNAKSVTVATAHSWTDRYTFDQILEARALAVTA